MALQPPRRLPPEDRLLLLFARQVLSAEHRQAIVRLVDTEPVDWELFLKSAVRLGIAPLVHALMRQHADLHLPLPAAAAQQFQHYVARQMLREAQREQRLIAALDLFRSHAMRVMLIKGAALKLTTYANPWYTIAHDLDLILDCRKDSLPQALVADIVRRLAHKGIEFDFYQHHDVSMNGVLAVDFDLVWRDARPAVFAEREVWLMCPEDLVISLCINSCRKRFVRLKSLCDIAETVRQHPNLDWAALGARARRFGCQNIVYAAMAVTARTVGCRPPDGALASLQVSRLRAACINRCADYTLQHLSLASPGGANPGRPLDWSIVLPYATYSLAQLVRKLAYLQRTWAGAGHPA
jgi:hypothetical protein